MQQLESQKAEAITTLTGFPVFSINEGRALLELPDFTESELAAHIEMHSKPTINFASTTGSGQEGGKALDIRRWRKKAAKNRSAKFSPDVLSRHEELTIKERLAAGLELDEVFKEPFTAGF